MAPSARNDSTNNQVNGAFISPHWRKKPWQRQRPAALQLVIAVSRKSGYAAMRPPAELLVGIEPVTSNTADISR
jgi:hypothetical protein